LPYAAGFIGKEFLLFQLFRADWFSLLIRSLWFVSFIFTPIYMSLFLRLVFFGSRRSPLTFFLTNQVRLRLSQYRTYSSRGETTPFLMTTPVTGFVSVYVLCGFWFFFFFFGEYLIYLFLLFNVLALPFEWEFVLTTHINATCLLTGFSIYTTTLLFVNIVLSWILVLLSFFFFFRGSFSCVGQLLLLLMGGFACSLGFVWFVFCGLLLLPFFINDGN
jgi:hypothetical protein